MQAASVVDVGLAHVKLEVSREPAMAETPAYFSDSDQILVLGLCPKSSKDRHKLDKLLQLMPL